MSPLFATTSAARETGSQDQQRSPTNVAQRSTKGTIVREEKGLLVFRPLDTSYEHHLVASTPFAGEFGRNVRARIRVTGRKVYTVMSGGNFVQPILGTPRIIQGRVVALEGSTLFVKAGSLFAVELPTGKDTIDMANGQPAVGSLVNVVALPGAAIEIEG